MIRVQKHHRFLGMAASLWLLSAGALCAGADSKICDRAADLASRKIGVPLEILLAVTRAETGRNVNKRLQPWPWTTNGAGKGRWFETREQALDHVRRQHVLGRKNFDIGCFQINVRWHGDQFESVEAMLDPDANAIYAAQFLDVLYREKGNWEDAVAAYHSRTPEHADRYRERFSRILANLLTRYRLGGSDGDTGPLEANASFRTETENKPIKSRKNALPLLHASTYSQPALGSLVALPNSGKAALIHLEGG